MIPLRNEVANENVATRKAEMAPDLDRDCLLYPLLDILCARNIPMIVRDMSIVEIVDNEDIAGNAEREEEDVVFFFVMLATLFDGTKLS